VAVVLAGLKLFLRLCPAHVVREHMDEIAGGEVNGFNRRGNV